MRNQQLPKFKNSGLNNKQNVLPQQENPWFHREKTTGSARQGTILGCCNSCWNTHLSLPSLPSSKTPPSEAVRVWGAPNLSCRVISSQELWFLFKTLWMCPLGSSETAKGAFPDSRDKPFCWRIQTFPDRQEVWLCFIFPAMSGKFSSSLSVCHIADTSSALHGHPGLALWTDRFNHPKLLDYLQGIGWKATSSSDFQSRTFLWGKVKAGRALAIKATQVFYLHMPHF